jgi:hypothetical protein
MHVAFNVLRAAIGIIAGIFAFCLFENNTTTNTAISLFCALVAALTLYPFITGGASSFLSGIVFDGSRGVVREELSGVRATIATGNNEAAIGELRALIEAHPACIEARFLLATLLNDRLQQPNNALQVVFDEFTRNQYNPVEWDPDHEKLGLLGIDILLDQGRDADAIRLLEPLVNMAPANQSGGLKRRLSSLRG